MNNVQSDGNHRVSTANIEILVGLIATLLIATGLLLYALKEPARIEIAQAALVSNNLNDAMTLYAQNCAVCHGLSGEGIGATPALDNPALKESDPQSLYKIIGRGLYNTAMPAWGLEDGGPLSDFQIDQLVVLIQAGDWQQTQDRVVNLGLAPLIPFTAEADPTVLENVKNLADGEVLAQGLTLYSNQCVACHGADGLGTGLAPALNDPVVREKGADELQRTILNGVPGTLMAGWEKSLAIEELQALVTLIDRWDEIPTGAVPAPDQPIPVTAESLAMGETLYASSCANCHGPEGQGSQRAPSLNVKAFLAETSDQAIQQIVTLGVPETAMPAWGDRMVEAEIQAIVGFIRSWEPNAPEVATPVRMRGPWRSSGTAPELPSGGVQPSGQGNGYGQGRGRQNNPGQGQGYQSTQVTPLPNVTPQPDQQGIHQEGADPAAMNTGLDGHAGGGTPPWQASTPTWWQRLDWRAVAILSLSVLLALVLIVAGLVGLKRSRQVS